VSANIKFFASTLKRKGIIVKRFGKPVLTTISALVILFGSTLALQSRSAANDKALDKGFSIKEYEAFHEVLHPLQHEALPKKDFKTIRAQAGELATRGEAIVKLGVPANLQKERIETFKEELMKFDRALKKFKADAEGGTDAQLEESYIRVHDVFELLAALLPRK
jgi:hypothetical protein